MDLTAAFRAEIPTGMDRAEADGELEARLEAAVARGRAAYPALPLDPINFVRHLARVLSRVAAEGQARLDALELEDLYLAAACGAGVEGAVAGFEARCGARIRVVLGNAVRSPDLRAEVEQQVRNALLVGNTAEPPKIVGYNGQGPLDRWVAVVAQRQALTLLRKDATEQRAREGAAVEAAMTGSAQPELLYAKERYRADFEQAMKEALLVLSERDRMLLRLHLISGVALEQIGKMYGVSQATASRWLARAREAVSTEVTRLLRERLSVSRDEMASLAGLVASQMDISISRILTPSDITG
jgi:RNA polymerase sigma-70 factor (ECF subfamily)